MDLGAGEVVCRFALEFQNSNFCRFGWWSVSGNLEAEINCLVNYKVIEDL